MSDRQGESADRKAAIEDDAIAWFVRMRGNVDAGLRAEFDGWYAASPEHEQAYHWAEAHFDASAMVKESTRLGGWRHKPYSWLMAGAAAAAMLLLVVGMHVHRTGSIDNASLASHTTAKPLVTGLREIRTWRLSDGSRVTLDADSRLEVAITNGERRVQLRRGKARFSVVREDRPFVVEAAAGAIVTQQGVFDVAFEPSDRVTVALMSGKADMRGQMQPAVYMVSSKALRLGMPVSYPLGSFAPAEVTSTVPDTRDWPDGWVQYRSIALRDLVAQANRYTAAPIILDDAAIGNLQASGRFKLTDTEIFVSRISEALDVSVSRRADGIHLARR